jgi:tetratricopeptide (TPR) repeat protein
VTSSHALCARILALLLSCAALVPGARAYAQTQSAASANEVALARKQFFAGVRAVSNEDWESALEAFERSYALYPHPETLINIAGARRRLGKLVAASEAYQSYLRIATSQKDAANRAVAERAFHELQGELSHVVLRVRHLAPTDRVTLDGTALGRGALGLELPVDPGDHELLVMRGQAQIAQRKFVAARAERLEIALELVPSVSNVLADPTLLESERPVPSPRPTREQEPGRPLRRQWWLWTAVGVVVAGGVASGVMLWPRGDRAGYDGDINGTF